MKRFEYFHLSLTERRKNARRESKGDKESWITRLFSEEVEFKNGRGARYVFVPEKKQSAPTAIVGRIGRIVSRHENAPPEGGLQDVERDVWTAMIIVVDPRHHNDGQKVACEVNAEVGTASSLLKRLIKQIEAENPESPYNTDVNPIFESNDFWEFVKENDGKIKRVQFDFSVPNMFGPEDEIEKKLEELRDEAAAKNVKTEISNPDGINSKSITIKQSVKYVSRGGGTMKAKALNGNTYSSNKKIKSVRLDEFETKITIKNIKKITSRILDRE